MGQRGGLKSPDEIERELLKEITALGSDGRRRAAIEALQRPTRDRVDQMWRGSPMKVAEARRLADWIGYELKLVRRPGWKDAPAYKDPPPETAHTPRRARTA